MCSLGLPSIDTLDSIRNIYEVSTMILWCLHGRVFDIIFLYFIVVVYCLLLSLLSFYKHSFTTLQSDIVAFLHKILKMHLVNNKHKFYVELKWMQLATILIL